MSNGFCESEYKNIFAYWRRFFEERLLICTDDDQLRFRSLSKDLCLTVTFSSEKKAFCNRTDAGARRQTTTISSTKKTSEYQPSVDGSGILTKYEM